VDGQYQREAAVADLLRLDCIREVRDEVRIKPPVQADQVRKKIHNALARITLANADNVEVEVEGSNVTLKGAVASWHEKGIAESTAWSVAGVSRVENHIAVV
jgi:osmotically-inducible protein OsmY